MVCRAPRWRIFMAKNSRPLAGRVVWSCLNKPEIFHLRPRPIQCLEQERISVMVTFSAGDLRNFAIVGHASSGKTTLSEAMLACAGAIVRMGNIAQGTTVSDYHVTERQHQISTQTSLLHCTWMDKKLNILDT